MTMLLDLCRPAIEDETPVAFDLPIQNTNRTVGTILSSEITRAPRQQGAARGYDPAQFPR